MPRIDDHSSLQRLAFLYLSIAHRSDEYLSDAELESVTKMLTARSVAQDRGAMQPVVMDALDAYMHTEDTDAAVREAAEHLLDVLSRGERMAVLRDLQTVAESDGVLLSEERSTLDRLADVWEVVSPTGGSREQIEEEWGVLHDLAYIYLVLAHGTDKDLARFEVQVMLNKLQEWEPEGASFEMRSVLNSAMNAYALGEDEERLERSIRSVRDGLPRQKRMAAMNDLVKIANADGVFLDNEEDLINHLLTEWEVDPFANYGSHGSKE